MITLGVSAAAVGFLTAGVPLLAAAASMPPPSTPRERWDAAHEKLGHLQTILGGGDPAKFLRAVTSFRSAAPSGAGAWGEGGGKFVGTLDAWFRDLQTLAHDFAREMNPIDHAEATRRFLTLKDTFPPLPEGGAALVPAAPVTAASQAVSVGVEPKTRPVRSEITIDLNKAGIRLDAHAIVAAVSRELPKVVPGRILVVLYPPITTENIILRRADLLRAFLALAERVGETLEERYKSKKDLQGFMGRRIVFRSESLKCECVYEVKKRGFASALIAGGSLYIDWHIETQKTP